jgi:dipeptidyl aminopeptidase/acylaminoacyl peptidase
MGSGFTMKAVTIDYRLVNPCAGAEVLVANMDDSLLWAYTDAVNNRALLARTSPIKYADYVIAPVQIHIGTADTRTPPTWAADINNRLWAQGKTVEYYRYPDQGHALQGQAWQLFMARTVDFYDRHLAAEQP